MTIELTPAIQFGILAAALLLVAGGALLGWMLRGPATAPPVSELDRVKVNWCEDEPIEIWEGNTFEPRWTNPKFTQPATRKIVGWTRKHGKFDKPIYEDAD